MALGTAPGDLCSPTPGPRTWKLSVARPGDLSEIAWICSEGIRGER